MENKYSDNKPIEHKPFAVLGKAKEELTKVMPVAPMPDKKQAVIVKLPPIKKLPTLEAKMAEAVRAAKENENYLNRISCHMADLVAEIIRFSSLKPMEKEVLAADIRAYEDELMTHLAPQVQPDKTHRLPLTVWKARIAYAEAMITSATTKNSLFDIIEGSKFYKLPDLIKLGIIEFHDQNGKGNTILIEVFNQIYRINGSRGEAERLKALLVSAMGRIKTADAEYYRKLRNALDNNASVHNPRKVFVPGTRCSVMLDIPTVEKGQRMPGGSMLVESNGENIRVVAAIGYFQKTMQEIADAGIFIPISSLKEERFRYKKGLSDQDNYYCRVLHNMLRRAKAALDEKAMREESEAPAEKAEHEATRKWLETEKAKT